MEHEVEEELECEVEVVGGPGPGWGDQTGGPQHHVEQSCEDPDRVSPLSPQPKIFLIHPFEGEEQEEK